MFVYRETVFFFLKKGELKIFSSGDGVQYILGQWVRLNTFQVCLAWLQTIWWSKPNLAFLFCRKLSFCLFTHVKLFPFKVHYQPDLPSPHSGWSGAAGGEQLSCSADSVTPEEDGCSGPQLSGAVPVTSSAIHRRGSEGALQTRPPQHAGLRQEEETRPTGSLQGLFTVLEFSWLDWKQM